MESKWQCPFEKIRDYPDCFQDCPDVSACEMKDAWKQTRPLPKLKTTSFPIDIKHIQVIAFAKAMDEVLVKNDHKGGWQNCDINYLRFRLIDEIGEYFHAISSDPNYYPVKEELIDIANFAMMLWDRS